MILVSDGSLGEAGDRGGDGCTGPGYILKAKLREVVDSSKGEKVDQAFNLSKMEEWMRKIKRTFCKKWHGLTKQMLHIWEVKVWHAHYSSKYRRWLKVHGGDTMLENSSLQLCSKVNPSRNEVHMEESCPGRHPKWVNGEGSLVKAFHPHLQTGTKWPP